MATGNFYTGGNHGYNVIEIEDEYDVEDTIANFTSDIEHTKGLKLQECNLITDVPRSFETGQQWEVYKSSTCKTIAVITLNAGYYEHANLDIYTGDALEEYDIEHSNDSRLIKKVVEAVESYTTQIKKVAQFSNGETIYEAV